MLIATITALILIFGGGTDAASVKKNVLAMQDMVKQHIADEERQTQVSDLLTEMVEELDGFEKRAVELQKGIFDVDKVYGSTAEDFRAVFKKINRNWDETQRRMTDLRFKMRDLMKRDEWNAVFADLRKVQEKG